MGLLDHVRLGLDEIGSTAASPTMTTTTTTTTTEAIDSVPSLKDGGSDRCFDVGEALRMIGKANNPAASVNNSFSLKFWSQPEHLLDKLKMQY